MDGHAGGLATGINSGVTGFGADLLILDDVVKDAAEADSAAHRCRVVNEYRSTLATRVHPGGPVLLVMTRWHEPDLAGELLDSEPDVWQHTNVPAMATAGVPDALAREPGATMTSALGCTPEHYAAARGTSGERAWATLYLGVPTAPAGGLVKCEWLDTWRLPAAPVAPIKTLVGVDPSDSSSGDSCGLIAASITTDGVVAVIADQSAPMTGDQCAREAVQLAADGGRIRNRRRRVRGAGDLYACGHRRVEARPPGPTCPRHILAAQGIWPRWRRRPGPPAALLQGLEVGTCRIAGHLPALEQAAVSRQAGQHQPDSLAAVVVAHDVLVHAAGAQVTIATRLAASLGDGTRRSAIHADHRP